MCRSKLPVGSVLEWATEAESACGLLEPWKMGSSRGQRAAGGMQELHVLILTSGTMSHPAIQTRSRHLSVIPPYLALIGHKIPLIVPEDYPHSSRSNSHRFFLPEFFQWCPNRSPCLSSWASSIIFTLLSEWVYYRANRTVPPLLNSH